MRANNIEPGKKTRLNGKIIDIGYSFMIRLSISTTFPKQNPETRILE